jgi:hypothetical protein
MADGHAAHRLLIKIEIYESQTQYASGPERTVT